ncbi:MAG: DNA-directed RNA polymerase subunit beta, partial [Armatimonadota bacterium]
RYDLARVGRHKLNKKLGLDIPLDVHTLTKADVVAIVRYLLRLSEGEGQVDDIDHLQNKRIRAVGELLQNQLRVGFLRMERVARERMTSLEPEKLTAQSVISIKPIQAAIKSFFGSGQLSQFMDQINPLAELAHKRRLSALGPGGLSKQSAKLEVRDVHHSHYGRICPIETPEGPNVGLIGYLAIHAKIDEFGFIQTPYRKVVNGRVTDEIVYLTADEEEEAYIAPASEPIDENGRFVNDRVTVRYHSTFPSVAPEQIGYCDVSAKQVFSVATSLIPFLENDDPVRGLAGSNMQRQAVPLLVAEQPLVKTGMERRTALDSGAIMLAEDEGIVTAANAREIRVKYRDGNEKTYKLENFTRTNMGTCITQKRRVRKGDVVQKGQTLADGPACRDGELALGRNLLVCFLPWEGYNYEDAILVSERLVRDDVLTSIHIEKFETEARDTKLGPEEITRDIPNVGEEALKDLDENGIVRIGAEVRAEDILVGKVAPKGQSELTAEEKLVIAIFGKKAEEMRDVSLLVPHGEKGIVVATKVFSRYKYVCEACGAEYNYGKPAEKTQCERCLDKLRRQPGDELQPGVNQLVRVYIAEKRKIMVGDKLTGRHGNKGVIARILPIEDMPHLPDGTPVDVCLNPLTVPSRMNIGQIIETHLGLIAREMGKVFVSPIFEGIPEQEVRDGLREVAARWRRRVLRRYANCELNRFGPFVNIPEDCEDVEAEIVNQLSALGKEGLEPFGEWLGLDAGEWSNATARQRAQMICEQAVANAEHEAEIDPDTGKVVLYDGRTGEPFNQPVAVGYMYILKLLHLVEDKIHARSTGPYSLVTQQPLGGKAQFGGQRFGEMEVWALEAYGAAYTLQEILTIKSDDVLGRVKTYEAIVKGENIMEPGIPESFKILIKELQSLGLQVTVETKEGVPVELKDPDEEGGE